MNCKVLYIDLRVFCTILTVTRNRSICSKFKIYIHFHDVIAAGTDATLDNKSIQCNNQLETCYFVV